MEGGSHQPLAASQPIETKEQRARDFKGD